MVGGAGGSSQQMGFDGNDCIFRKVNKHSEVPLKP